MMTKETTVHLVHPETRVGRRKPATLRKAMAAWAEVTGATIHPIKMRVDKVVQIVTGKYKLS